MIKRKKHNLIQILRQFKRLEMFVPAMLACLLFIFTFLAGVFHFFVRFVNLQSVSLIRYVCVEEQSLGQI